ncbi:MAG: hypothetical protein VB876_19055, partial [Pirellulales bacterium]
MSRYLSDWRIGGGGDRRAIDRRNNIFLIDFSFGGGNHFRPRIVIAPGLHRRRPGALPEYLQVALVQFGEAIAFAVF